MHGVLTENNLFDGSIITPTENYYIEPAARYSSELPDNGIHTIVYKTSDVHMLPHHHQTLSNDPKEHDCASQRLHEKMKRRVGAPFEKLMHFESSTRNTDDSSEYLSRNKRWLADEVGLSWFC